MMLEYSLPGSATEVLGGRQAAFAAANEQQVREQHLTAVGTFLTGCFREANPGLTLDRMVGYPTHKTRSDGKRGAPVGSPFTLLDEANKKLHLGAVCEAMRLNATSLNSILSAGWEALVAACDAEQFGLKTVWRLAMHLSRATAVENASLCLHPVYGFPYLPGTGLKGLASTWAQLHGPGKCSDEFKRIFGTQGGTGSVLFLEAWPAAISSDANRPTIEVDIVNNHHPEYYRNRGDGAPPGDWESPIPVYFLAVAPNVTFRFAVAKARPVTTADDVDRAKEWLTSGLTQLGFGAKTAAGYGYFAELDGGGGQGPAAAMSQGDPLESFKARHKSLLSNPKKSDIGNAVAELEQQTEPGELRTKAAQWVYECLEACGMLTEHPNKNPTPYGERLQALMQTEE